VFAQVVPMLALPPGSEGPPPHLPGASGDEPEAGEDLPYKVEIWDGAKLVVDAIVAVTASSSIGYAAYYAATREYPDRYITLRFKGSVLIRWNAPTH
jgi:hypothetical protein